MRGEGDVLANGAARTGEVRLLQPSGPSEARRLHHFALTLSSFAGLPDSRGLRRGSRHPGRFGLTFGSLYVLLELGRGCAPRARARGEATFHDGIAKHLLCLCCRRTLRAHALPPTRETSARADVQLLAPLMLPRGTGEREDGCDGGAAVSFGVESGEMYLRNPT